METIQFDPRIFISPPFVQCPICKKQSFGILSISSHSYSRRCKECMYPPGNKIRESSFSLPKLHKKIIYLDQFALSDMVKILDPSLSSNKTIDPFWLSLFEKLDRLCKLQLIVCPISNFHQNESLLSSFYEKLKSMYLHLSHNINFYDNETIKRFQLLEYLRCWIDNKDCEALNFNTGRAIHGNIDGWNDKFIISVNCNFDSNFIEKLRKEREIIHEAIKDVFHRWQTEKERTFQDWFNEEVSSYGSSHLQGYINTFAKTLQYMKGEISMDDYFPITNSYSNILLTQVQQTLEENGIDKSEIVPKTFEFLKSPKLQNVPFIKISSMLWAAIARKTALGGMKEPPNKGMVTDIEMISVLLPYCDAMFIDNACRGYLQEKPLCQDIGFCTKLFSIKNRQEFIEYLNGIENGMSEDHLSIVNEVYGNSWVPYTSMYVDNHKKNLNNE